MPILPTTRYSGLPYKETPIAVWLRYIKKNIIPILCPYRLEKQVSAMPYIATPSTYCWLYIHIYWYLFLRQTDVAASGGGEFHSAAHMFILTVDSNVNFEPVV